MNGERLAMHFLTFAGMIAINSNVSLRKALRNPVTLIQFGHDIKQPTLSSTQYIF